MIHQLTFGLLGPLHAQVGGDRLAPTAPTQRSLLAALLAADGRPLSTEQLCDRIGEEAPASRRALQITASRLRAWLSQHLPGPDLLLFSGESYRIAIDAGAVDLHRFRRLRARATAATDPGRRLDLLLAALDLWQGTFLEDLPGWFRERCGAWEVEQARRAVAVQAADLARTTGRVAEALPRLARVAAAYPLDEPVAAQLALLAAAAGSQVEALRIIDTTTRELRTQLGMEPGPHLTRIRTQVLRQEIPPAGTDSPPSTATAAVPLPAASAAVPLPAASAALPLPVAGAALTLPAASTALPLPAASAALPLLAAGPIPAMLPADVPDFTGRDKVIAHVTDVLTPGDDTALPVVALVGRAGVGKSALAVHVGHRLRARYPHGQLFANLRGIESQPTEPGEILSRFLRVLGIDGSSIPPSDDERAEMYRNILADRRVLVVLDNAADERQIRPLLPGTGASGVIITSRRRPTGIPGCDVVALDALSPEHSHELVRRIIGPERAAAEPAAATTLVALCSQLPLALRVAGARLAARPHWRLADLVTRLSDERRRLDELAHADLEVRANLALSYRALHDTEQTLFRRLGLLDAPDFPGWIAAALLDQPEPTAEDHLERLVDAHLVDVAGTDRAGQRRYRLHDLVRLYARERAHEQETPQGRTEALARVCGGLIEMSRIARQMECGNDYTVRTVPPAPWQPAAPTTEPVKRDHIAWFDAERATIVTAVHQAASAALHTTCWQLAAMAARMFEVDYHLDDWKATHEIAIETVRTSGDADGEAVILFELGSLHSSMDRFKAAMAHFDAAELICRSSKNRHVSAMINRHAGIIERFQGRTESALRRFRLALRVANEVDDPANEAYALRNIGQIHLTSKRPEAALKYMLRALRKSQEIAGPRIRLQVMYWLAETYAALDRDADAMTLLQQVYEDTSTIGDIRGTFRASSGLFRLAFGRGDLDQAHDYLHKALECSIVAGESIFRGQALLALGELNMARHDWTAGEEALREALPHWERIEAHTEISRIRELLAVCRRSATDLDQ